MKMKMQMNVLRSISQGEVVADLCSCDELLKEYMSDDDAEYEADWNASKDDDDPEWEDQASIDAAWDRRQKCLFVWDNRPDLSEEEALRLHAEFEVYYSAGNTFADALEWSGIAQNPHPTVRFCRKYSPYMPEQECYEAYETYRSYRDEGQTMIVSRQYAGLL